MEKQVYTNIDGSHIKDVCAKAAQMPRSNCGRPVFVKIKVDTIELDSAIASAERLNDLLQDAAALISMMAKCCPIEVQPEVEPDH